MYIEKHNKSKEQKAKFSKNNWEIIHYGMGITKGII